MNLDHFDIQDFLTDESFYQSVKDPKCEEALFWKAWLDDNPEKKEIADQAKIILLSIDFKDKAFSRNEISQMWKSIKEKTNDEYPLGSSFNGTKPSPWRYLKVAAVFLAFVIASVLFFLFRNNQDEQQTHSYELIEKFNPIGQKLTVFLSDGSMVKLNADSRISYEKPFNEKERIVTLEGEAFFEVVSDKNRPFIVRTGNLETKVLGTSFNVKAYPEENQINISVKTGKVSVENTQLDLDDQDIKSIVLLPTEMATYKKDNHSVGVSNFDPMEVLSWSDGTLYFNDATMEEFVSKLERWYGVDIIVKREKKIKKGIVGEFKDQSLEEILMGTKEASQFEYEFVNGKVIIN